MSDDQKMPLCPLNDLFDCVSLKKVKDFGLSESDLAKREVDHVDIAYDKVPEKSYKENEVSM